MKHYATTKSTNLSNKYKQIVINVEMFTYVIFCFSVPKFAIKAEITLDVPYFSEYSNVGSTEYKTLKYHVENSVSLML